MATAALQSIAEAFAADWKEMFGNALQVKAGKPQAGDFYLTLKKDKKLGKEGYAIAVAKYVTVSAPETNRCLLGYTYLASDRRTSPTIMLYPMEPCATGRIICLRIYDGLRTQVHFDGLHARSGEDDVLLQDECTAGTFER